MGLWPNAVESRRCTKLLKEILSSGEYRKNVKVVWREKVTKPPVRRKSACLSRSFSSVSFWLSEMSMSFMVWQ